MEKEQECMGTLEFVGVVAASAIALYAVSKIVRKHTLAHQLYHEANNTKSYHECVGDAMRRLWPNSWQVREMDKGGATS